MMVDDIGLLFAYILLQRQNNELDADMLSLTGEILAVNPDFSTLWNIRRMVMENFASEK